MRAHILSFIGLRHGPCPLGASIRAVEDLYSARSKGGKETDLGRGPPLCHTPHQGLQPLPDLFPQQLGESAMDISRNRGSERFSNLPECAQLVSVGTKV